MYPGTLTDNGQRIGNTTDDLLLTTDALGALTIGLNKKSGKTSPAFVIENEWHHYAISFSSGTATCYRDGVALETVKPGTTSVPIMKQFCLGGSAGPMNAIVDELRVWKKALTATQLRATINRPIDNPSELEDLVLYYDFNQSSGDVVDKSVSQLTGQRHAFGPDCDAWSSSRGIFCLDFDNTTQDVTSKYLKNYKAPFTATNKFVNGTSRFKQLATGTTTSPWIQENSVTENGVTTEFHVDQNKSNYLTLSTKWDGFASEVKNLKLYQTVELPAGAYLFSVTSDKEFQPGANYLVAATGEGLPDFSDLDASALSYGRCDQAIKFIISQPTTVSLGLLSNQSGQSCHTIKNFQLRTIGFEEKKADMIDGIRDTRNQLAAMPTLTARGGLGCIIIDVEEPQRVEVFTTSGQLLWSSFVNGQMKVPARKGLYVVGRQKVLVR